MYFSKRSAEPIPQEQTDIWTCTKEGCSCWLRNDFSFQSQPTCPICHSIMVSDTKLLPVLKKF